MEDEGRKQEIINALDELNGAAEEFAEEVESHEIDGRLEVALDRLRAALKRHLCELSEDLPDSSKKVFLDQAKEHEKHADRLEKKLDAR
ncbi:MAG: hypothetical protein ISN29_03020 [Gammaproteobacteria bacterium AqS3]|nr:hypothetical protein [Gammaproteobacteria bacterium AqS3]